MVDLDSITSVRPSKDDAAGNPRARRLEENIGAADVELTVGDLTEIKTAVQIQVGGVRTPEHLERTTGLRTTTYPSAPEGTRDDHMDH